VFCCSRTFTVPSADPVRHVWHSLSANNAACTKLEWPRNSRKVDPDLRPSSLAVPSKLAKEKYVS